jgi:hypothetical protein
MTGLLKPANSLLQQLTESSQPIELSLGTQAATGKICIISVFTEAVLKYIFEYLGNYQIGIISKCFHRDRFKINFLISWELPSKKI